MTDYEKAMHAHADRYEWELSDAMQQAFAKLQKSIAISAVIRELVNRDARHALALVTDDMLKNAHEPAGYVAGEVFVRGAAEAHAVIA